MCASIECRENQKWKMTVPKETSSKCMNLQVTPYQSWETSSLEEIISCLENVPTLPSVGKMIWLMQKCIKEKSVFFAKRISTLVCNHGLLDNLSLGNHLVQLLAVCGALGDAQEIFDRLPYRKEYAWASLIQEYSSQGCPHRTLDLFDKMQKELVRPSVYTYLPVFRACARLKQVGKGRATHAESVAKGYDVNIFVGNSLVDMYAKCGSLTDAQEVFNQQRVKSTVSWNAMITAYADLGFGKEALLCLEEMQGSGCSPDCGTFVCSLKACGVGGAIPKNRQLHSRIVKEGWDSVSLIGDSLIDMYAKCGLLEEAQKTLEHLPSKTVVSWTALISGYIEHGPASEALTCYKKMQRAGLYPDCITFVCSLKACGSMGAIHHGRDVHLEVVKVGWENEFLIGNILVDVYSKCKSIKDAQKVFDDLSLRNVVAWTALIAGLVDCGHFCEALRLLQQMQEEGIAPNAATYTCSLKACGNVGAIDQGRCIHAGLSRDRRRFICWLSAGAAEPELHGKDGGVEASQEKLAGALVDMYSRCGQAVEAKRVFDEMPSTNLVTCNALIMGCSRQGEDRDVFDVVCRMRKQNIAIDAVSVLGLLTVCSHAGLCEVALRYYAELTAACPVDLTVEHCNCVIDLFGRTGQLGEAVGMLETMPFQPNLVSFGSILGSCRSGSQVEVAKQALECAAVFGRDLAPALISMSNVYATAHMWEYVETIKAIIQQWRCS